MKLSETMFPYFERISAIQFFSVPLYSDLLVVIGRVFNYDTFAPVESVLVESTWFLLARVGY